MIKKNRIVRTIRAALYCVHCWDDCYLHPHTKWMMIYSMVDNLYWPGRKYSEATVKEHKELFRECLDACHVPYDPLNKSTSNQTTVTE